MLGIVNVVIVLGALVSLIGAALLANFIGTGDYVIRHLTSRNLGTLPPGYAASRRGFQVYALIVLAIGLFFLGLGLAGSAPTSGAALIGIGLVAFGFGSVLAIRGEVRTYRELKR